MKYFFLGVNNRDKLKKMRPRLQLAPHGKGYRVTHSTYKRLTPWPGSPLITDPFLVIGFYHADLK